MGLGDFISGVFGSKDQYHADAPQLNSADYQAQYGAGGSVARQNQLSQLGAQGANYGNTAGMQGAQAQALGLDMAAAQGKAPSVAQNQLQQGLAESQAAQAAGAASTRGGGAGLAAATSHAADVQAAQGAQANNQAAQLRASEMATARGQVGDLATQGLGQQIGMSQFNAQLQQGYEGMGNQVAANQLNAGMQYEAQNSANQLGADQINAGVASGNAQQNFTGGMAVLGMGASAAGAVAGAASDPAGKTAVAPEGAFAMGAPAPVVIVDSSRGSSDRGPAKGDDRSKLPKTVPIIMDSGPQQAPGAQAPAAVVVAAPDRPSVSQVMGAMQQGAPGQQQGQQSSFQAGKEFGDSMVGAGKGLASLVVSSPPSAKMGVASEGGAKPGGGDYFSPATYVMSGGNPTGEAQLAARDAHTANFAQMGAGQGNWFNASNAAPWTSESSAAQQNLNHYFGGGAKATNYGAGMGAAVTSDAKAKEQARQEGANDALAAQARALGADIDAHRNGFEWMNPDTAVAEARPGGSTAVDAQMDVQHPTSFLYKDKAENGGARRHGVMTTDVKQGPAGPDLVKQGPKGEVISIPSATSALMAQTGRLHERQTATEQKLASILGEAAPDSPPPSTLVYPGGQPVLANDDRLSNAPLQRYQGDTIGRPLDDSLESNVEWRRRLALPPGANPYADNAALPAGKPNLNPDLSSDPQAKAAVHAEGFAKGVQAAMKASPDMQQQAALAAPGYATPAVMSGPQRDRVMAQIAKGQTLGAAPDEIQRHIDFAMQQPTQQAPAIVAAPAGSVAIPSAPPPRAPRGYAIPPTAAVVEQRARPIYAGVFAPRGR